MSNIRRKLGIAFTLIAFLAGCAPSSPTPTPPSYWPTNGWRSAAPEEQGMDSEKLAQMVEHIQQEKLDLHSLLIVRNGYLVGELYAYPYSAGQAHGIMSVTKSVIDALIGIAMAASSTSRSRACGTRSRPSSARRDARWSSSCSRRRSRG